MDRDYVFVSYSHDDGDWLDLLRILLKPFQWGRSYQDGGRLWADPYIRTGELWRREIGDGLARTRVAVLLVSKHFLASEFITGTELPAILEAANAGHVTVVCVPVRTAVVDLACPQLLEFQWPRPFDRPLDLLPLPEREAALADIFRKLHGVVVDAGLADTIQPRPVPGPLRQPDRAMDAGSTPASTMGAVVGFPRQRPHYIPRLDVRDAVRSALLQGPRNDAAGTGAMDASARVGVFGQGGLGKTVLAIDIAQAEAVRRAFPDGIFWVDVGQSPDLTTLQRNLIRRVTGDASTVESVPIGTLRLRDALANRACLLVLDDVWRLEDAQAFDVAGGACRLLLTTRDGAILTALGAREFALDVLDDAGGLDVLAAWTNQPPALLPREAPALVKRCGHVPLAISVAGALIRDGTSWHDVLGALEAGNLRFLDHPYGNVFASLRLGVDALPAAVRERYDELAVVPADVALPVSLVALLWHRTGGLADYETGRTLADLHRKGLLDLGGDAGNRHVRLHDLQRDFLQLSVADVRELHRRLLDAAASLLAPPTAPSHRAWWTLPRDQPYLWRHVAHHLSKAALDDELNALLLDFDWVAAKLRATDVNAAIGDYDVGGLNRDAKLIQRTLRFSRHVLARDPSQMPGQMLAHLGPDPSAAIASMRAGAERHASAWLRPLSSTHTPAAGPLLQTLSGHTDSVVSMVALDRERVVSAATDGTLRVWDVGSGVQLRVIEGALSTEFPGDTTLARLDSRRVLVGVDSHVALFDIDSGAVLARFEGHDKRIVDVATLDDGSFVSIDADRTIVAWDVATGEPTLRQQVGDTYGGLYARIAALDRERIVCSPGDFTVEVWDLTNKTRLHRLEGHRDVSPAIAVLDRNRFVTAHAYGIVKEWQVGSDEPVRTFTGHRDWIRKLVTLRGGRLAWALDDGSIQITDLTTGEPVERLGGHSDAVEAIADIEHGRFVSASDDGTLRVWELGTGHAQTNWPSWGSGVETRSIAVLDDTLVVATQADHRPRVFDARSRASIRVLRHDNVGAVCRVDERRVLTLSSSKGARLWDASTGTPMGSVDATAHTQDDVAVLADGRIALTAHFGVIIWNPDLDVVDATLESGVEIAAVSAIDDTRLALTSFHGQLSVYDVRDGERVWSRQGAAYMSRAAGIGRDELAAGGETSVLLLDTASGAVRKTLAGHSEAVDYVVGFDGRWIVSAAADRTIRVWDVETGKLLKTLDWSHERLDPVIAKLDEHHLAWADGNTLHVFQVATLIEVAAFTIDAPVSALACAPASRTIAVGDVQGNVHTFRLETTRASMADS